MASVVVLISGRGSNLRAILESVVGESVTAVISDNPQAVGLKIATAHDKPAIVCDYNSYRVGDNFESELINHIDAYSPNIVALAGFMRILGKNFVRRYQGRLVNIHPSLLPDFRGLNTHRRALAAKAKTHGCTVHWVNETVDDGEVIAQSKVTVQADDSVDDLAARVLAAEHVLYPRVLAQLVQGQ